MAANQASILVNGSLGQRSTLGINVPAITPGNLAGTQTALAALGTAVDAVVAGIVNGYAAQIKIITNANILTATPGVIRGEKWIITAVDTDNRLYTYTIPFAKQDDVALLAAGTRASYDPGDARWVAFVTAFEAVAKSPTGLDLNVVTIKQGTRTE